MVKRAFPRTTAGLKLGDYCLLQRSDGLLVPFVFVCGLPKTRVSVVGGIADLLLTTPEANAWPPRIRLRFVAHVHVQCYGKNGTPIVGNVAERLDPGQVAEIERTYSSSGIGVTHAVWGYRTLYKYAERVGIGEGDVQVGGGAGARD